MPRATVGILNIVTLGEKYHVQLIKPRRWMAESIPSGRAKFSSSRRVAWMAGQSLAIQEEGGAHELEQSQAAPSKPDHRAHPRRPGQSQAAAGSPQQDSGSPANPHSAPRTESARAKASQHKGALLLKESCFARGEPFKTPWVILQRITYPSPAVAGCTYVDYVHT